MESERSKLRQQSVEQTEHHVGANQRQDGVEFGSIEEMLRYDAAQVEVPPRVAERLVRSVAQEFKAGRSWWRRIFSS